MERTIMKMGMLLCRLRLGCALRTPSRGTPSVHRTITTSTLEHLVKSSRSRLPALKAPESHQPHADTFISPERFGTDFLSPKRPGYFTQLVSAEASPYRWPACQEWSRHSQEAGEGRLHGLASIRELQGRTVEVEVAAWGRGYGDGISRDAQKQREAGGTYQASQLGADAFDETAVAVAWTQLQLGLPMFFDLFIDGKYPQQGPFPLVGYLAQQDLFDQSPTLQRQCPPLPHAFAGERGAREQWRRNLWIGGAGTFTPIHCDPYDNLFVQVVGRKRVHIFPPSLREHVHLFDAASTRQPNTSSIPTEAPLLVDCPSEECNKYADFCETVLAAKEACHVIMNPGDCVYIPRGWFHCVQSLEVSASVNAWFR